MNAWTSDSFSTEQDGGHCASPVSAVVSNILVLSRLLLLLLLLLPVAAAGGSG